jgi:NADH-quinone oxidoreductase subunit J
VILGVLTLAAAIGVVVSRNAVVSAMCLMATLFLTGALYFGLGSFFIGAAQILIYAGAISVLFVFVVMLLDLKPLRVLIPGRPAWIGVSATLVGLFLLALAWILLPGTADGPVDSLLLEATPPLGALEISAQLISRYHLAFQLAGLLILATVLGVVVLGRPKRDVSGGGEL